MGEVFCCSSIDASDQAVHLSFLVSVSRTWWVGGCDKSVLFDRIFGQSEASAFVIFILRDFYGIAQIIVILDLIIIVYSIIDLLLGVSNFTFIYFQLLLDSFQS